MIQFFKQGDIYFACQIVKELDSNDISKLKWLFADADVISSSEINEACVGPRASMVSPWSTNAVEITQNMGISGIERIEKFIVFNDSVEYDPMLFQKYESLKQSIFDVDVVPSKIIDIESIAEYNQTEGLALSDEEVQYLEELSSRIGRKLTDSEVFGFSQVNSEHCRHKIFNGTFIIDGQEQDLSLFKMIKETSAQNPNKIVSAYKDNVAFVEGPKVEQFSPKDPSKPSFYGIKDFESVLSLKAETHNFPTTVEPFNGAATGSGGEIRDRLAGGQGALPLAGTAVYMTSYSRLKENRPWEQKIEARKWLYQTPMDILIKASNGASDFGNKFGQPLISGSLLTFEHQEEAELIGFDKVIMLAGGVGIGKKEQALKNQPEKGDKIVILGGDNYRIGMGGAAVSSADTGEFGSGIELNAIQRSNPEMQKRTANTIRAMVELDNNPIVSIHDHGAGGHLNCLSELVEETGGVIEVDKLPIGDKTLSNKEIIGNESQERMGLVIKSEDVELLREIAARERSPMYVVGEVTDDKRFVFENKDDRNPMDLSLHDMFGSSPKTILNDTTKSKRFKNINYQNEKIVEYISNVLRLEAVACKDWLTNKVDRCVGGLVAKQQCVGPLQLPLNNCGVMALDYHNHQGVATAIGHAPVASLVDEEAGARLSIAEALTNIVWAPMQDGLESISLSANWMWPCKNDGEDARLYKAVKAVSDMAIQLGINIPTGKDSLSMAQKYSDKTVLAPGTVIISSAGHCKDIRKVVEPVFQIDQESSIYYINLSQDTFKLGGSSFAQTLNSIGEEVPDVKDINFLKNAFNTLQECINGGRILAGHDISSGGLVTCLLEMCFSNPGIGADINLTELSESDFVKVLFAENSGVIVQADGTFEDVCKENGIELFNIGKVNQEGILSIENRSDQIALEVSKYRDDWYETSHLLDQKQCANNKADERFTNYKEQPLEYDFPVDFDGRLPEILVKNKPIAAIIREKGSNSEREMANAMYRAGFDVKDVHMTDLIQGREDLSDVQFLGAVGGFSNSDVLGSAKGWAGAFLYNERANKVITDYFNRKDTLSVGICNGCQLFTELELIYPQMDIHPKMLHNDSHKHESAFTSVEILENNSVMLSSMSGAKLGIWISHGEGKFQLSKDESAYNIIAKYGYEAYPSNPNGSDYNAAMISSIDGRHLATMPHLERSLYPWNWAHYPRNRKSDEVSPWIEAFVNAYKWLK